MRAPNVLVAILLAAAPVAAAENLLNLPARGVALRSGDAQPALVSKRGEVPLALPAGTTLRQSAGEAAAWYVAGTAPEGEGTRLVLLAGAGTESPRALDAPGSRATLVHAPALLARGSQLEGVAWLEGERHGRFAVVAARRTADGWATAEAVAPAPERGSRLALASAVLADGTWVLVWSAFDGVDDEIWWTRREAQGWRAAERVGGDDAVPDITPTLRATPDGALLAWSEYDGNDYRLRLARLAGDRWAPAGVLGGKGATLPRFVESVDATLLYRDVEAGGWTVAGLAADGKVLRRASAEGPTSEVPAVEIAADGAVFRWTAAPELRAGWIPTP